MKNRLAVLTVLALAAILSPNTLRGDQLTIPVLGESWFIAAEAPPLQIFQGRRHDAGYQFQGASSDGFNVSCFVEKPHNDKKEHAACFDHYWSKMKRNPLIDQATVKISKEENFVRVSYDFTKLPPKLPKHHVNYYIVHNGRWIDIHISMVTAQPRKKVTAAFEKSLRFVAADSSEKENTDEDKQPG